MKVKVEPLNKKTGPSQCFRCQGFFHSSRFCTRNPKCVKCGKPHLTRDCKKTPEEEPTCCLCQGKHPANFLGCSKNPLTNPHHRPKVNAWDERAKKRRDMQEAAKRKAEQETAQQARPPPTHAAELNPKATLPSTSTKKPTQKDYIAQDPDQDHSENLASTLEDFQDPRVIEMLDVLKKFVQISKTNKTHSILNKINEFEIFINSQDPDLIALQETNLRPCHSLHIPNYKTYRNDRLTHRGGVTAILIKSSIPHHVLDIATHSLENTTVNIEGERNITISSIYRPPGSPAPSLISDLLKIFRN
ncbi:RNA-directed DNA polymerase from mobile element jockey [Trichonephila clavipes]|nr:RNA-directed DNA polymerase from mobile element jockey [Trichonephila clavipes]